MIKDPELKAMSEVFEALRNLDTDTQGRVVNWVLSKLSEGSNELLQPGSKAGKKLGRPPGKKQRRKLSRKRGKPPGSLNKSSLEGSNRLKRPESGRSPGIKRKRGRPIGSRKKINS